MQPHISFLSLLFLASLHATRDSRRLIKSDRSDRNNQSGASIRTEQDRQELGSRPTPALIRVQEKEYKLSPIIVRRLRSLGMTWQIRSNSAHASEGLVDAEGQVDWDRLKDQVKLK